MLVLINHGNPVRVCDACFELEAKRATFETKYWKMLQTGTVFRKMPNGALGRPRDRHIRVTECRQYLFWGDPKSGFTMNENHVLLSSVSEIRVGQTTQAFKWYGDKRNESVSFSVICTGRTLDLEADTKKTRDLWVDGLKHLLSVTELMTASEAAKMEKYNEDRDKQQKSAAKRRSTAKQVRDKYSR